MIQHQTATLTEIVLPGIVEPDGLVTRQRPVPAPGRGQALVRVDVTGVSYAEGSMRRGRYPGQPKFPFVPGYDLVGTVTATGDRVDPGLVGRRVAAATKVGGWATHAVLDARTLVPVADDVDPAAVETVLVNGITAWQMLHRKARVAAGGTILVHGVNGGVANLVAQLARHAGIRVIGTASARNHDGLREQGVEPVDYRDPNLSARIRELAPEGVDAVFDHLGGASFDRSFGLLRRGGTLVGYGTASQRDDSTAVLAIFAGVLAKFTRWSLTPNGGRSATFYNFWGGSKARPAAFRSRLAQDLTSMVELVRQGVLTPRIATRMPLTDAAKALTLAESGTVSGKVLLIP